MVWVAGADASRAGWFRVSRECGTGALRFDLVACARLLIDAPPPPSVLAIDIPIGLTERGPRACDRLARARLGRPRAASVFPAPIRPALGAASRSEASQLTRSRDGRGVSAQAWSISAKVREVDRLLRSRPDARQRIYEAHPELSFCAWAGGRPIAASKKTTEGLAARRRLVEGWLGRGVLERARNGHRRSDLSDDDILDALAALWTATRIASGTAECLPRNPPRDAAGLPMRIVF